MRIEENVPLAPHTTFRLGGPARHFARVKNLEELRQSLDYARDQNLATLILGGGSNLLISDEGFDGLVIKIEITGVESLPANTAGGGGPLVVRARGRPGAPGGGRGQGFPLLFFLFLSPDRQIPGRL